MQSRRWISGGDGPAAQKLLMKLRWCTLGPQFDWTARVYDTGQPYKTLPAELHALACRLSASAANYLPDRAGVHINALAHSSPGMLPWRPLGMFCSDVFLRTIYKHGRWLRRLHCCSSKLGPGRGSGELLS